MLAPLLGQGSGARAAPLAAGACCCATGNAARPSTPPAAPWRAPLPPGKCPCSERYSTAPDAPHVALDLSLAAVLPTWPPAPAPSGEVERTHGLPPPFLEPPLRLWNCVWLC
jgi:hypothetical protein